MADNEKDYGASYGPAIMALDREILRLQNARATLIALSTGRPADSIPDVSAAPGAPMELPVGALLNKSIPEAVKLYLGSVKKKLTNKQIADALRDAGVESTSGDFLGVVTGALNRLKVASEVLRFPDGWALAALYPAHVRAATADTKKKGTKKRQKKAGTPKKAKTVTKPSPAATTTDQNASDPKSANGSVEQVTREFLFANPTRVYQAGELAKQLDRKVQIVSLLLGKMAHKGIIQKVGSGYQAMKQAGH